MSYLSTTDQAFDLLVAVAGRALVEHPPLPDSIRPAKKSLPSSSSSSSISSVKNKNALPKAQSSTTTSSPASFFIEDSEDGQTVYRRASVYFSIVKSSRKFPGYFTPAEKRIIVQWYVFFFLLFLVLFLVLFYYSIIPRSTFLFFSFSTISQVLQ